MLLTPEVKTKRAFWPMIAACALEAGTVLLLVTLTAVATIPPKKKDNTPIVYFPETPRVEIVKTVHHVGESNPFSTNSTGGSTRPTRVFVLPTGKADLNLGNNLPEMGEDERVVFSNNHQTIPAGNNPFSTETPSFAPPPDVPVVKTVQRVRVGGKVKQPVLMSRTNPLYPQLAKNARIQGTVRLQALISTSGRILNAQVISGHPLLLQAALDAVKTWTYQPTELNDEPVEVQTTIDVNFTLSN